MLIKNPPAEIAKDLWMLGTGEYPVFCFRDTGESVVFEAGVSAEVPVIGRQMAALGITPDSVKQLVITHAHPDHVMGVPGLRKLLPNVTVLASAPAAKTLAFEKAIGFFCKVDHALTASLKTSGSISDADQGQPPTEMKIAVDRTLKAGDTVRVGGASFAVLETPGHSDCSLSFYEPRQRVLIISDATGYYLPEPDFWWPNYFVDYGTYVRSIERLAQLDAEVLCLSHNAVLCGREAVADYFRGALAATTQYHQRIVAEAQAGRTPDEIAAALGAEVFQRTQLMGPDFFVKNCGLLVKLSLKHAAGGANG
jgi:glyoxylase-like metal-dependent hydrolase (beta-lactamase superfamily II)